MMEVRSVVDACIWAAGVSFGTCLWLAGLRTLGALDAFPQKSVDLIAWVAVGASFSSLALAGLVVLLITAWELAK